MANKEHLEVIEQGVEAWNQWRKENPNVLPDLRNALLFRPSLFQADLSNVDLSFSNLGEADLSHSNLSNARLVAASLTFCDFSDANLFRADLNDASLYEANLRNANLVLTNLRGTILTHADFTNAEMLLTDLGFTDLSDVKGLDSIIHHGPSTIGIDTIYNSKASIPITFLRGAGVPDIFIEYASSLVASSFEFYSCFISFTELDNVFSERLYNDLQNAGVRCWRWKENAKWGKTLMRSIDEAVRLYDKLVVICSEQSLNSPAVIREIERALQKEDEIAQQGKESEVLFPIRLDDYIFSRWQHHRKSDVIAKNVGDFHQWMKPDKYRKSLERLINDLKAEHIK